MKVLGIDIGGSGVKGAPVDVKKGKLLGERYRIPTVLPGLPSPDFIMGLIKVIIKEFKWKGPIGCGFPSPIVDGIAVKASNISPDWIGVDVGKMITLYTGFPTKLINDADAAGLAEIKFGAGKGVKGVVFMVTVGTGLGTALFTDGKLVPNTELGHIRMDAGFAETYTSDATRRTYPLTWDEWADRFNEYLREIEKLFYPSLIIVGGGASKKFDRFSDLININTPVVPAKMLNASGIIGAAYYAKDLIE